MQSTDKLLSTRVGNVQLDDVNREWLKDYLSSNNYTSYGDILTLARNLDKHKDIKKKRAVATFLTALIPELTKALSLPSTSNDFNLGEIVNLACTKLADSERQDILKVTQHIQSELSILQWQDLQEGDISDIFSEIEQAHLTEAASSHLKMLFEVLSTKKLVRRLGDEFTKIKDQHQNQYAMGPGIHNLEAIKDLLRKLSIIQQRYDWVKLWVAKGASIFKLDASFEETLQEYITLSANLKENLHCELGHATPLTTELVRIGPVGELELLNSTWERTKRIQPTQDSHTVAFVGPCGGGKSTIICNLTPWDCPKPSRAERKQACPTSGNLHIFDSNKITNKYTPSDEMIRILDIEGLDGAKFSLPQDIKQHQNYENIRDETILRRWEIVQELPRLCYAISNIIVYVDLAPLSRCLSDTFRDFCYQTQNRMGHAWLPDLIIVFNKTDDHIETSVADLTREWLENHDKNQFFQSRFASIQCIALPTRMTVEKALIWCERMEDLKNLILESLRSSVVARRAQNMSYDRIQWCQMVETAVSRFHGYLDPATLLVHDTSTEVTSATRCCWKFQSLFVDIRDHDTPITENQFNTALRVTVELLANLDLANVYGIFAKGEILRNDAEVPKQGEAEVFKKLQYILERAAERAPCLATNQKWKDSANNPIRCLALNLGHGNAHSTKWNLIESVDSAGLITYATSTLRMAVSKAVRTKFKKWPGTSIITQLPTVEDMKVMYDRAYVNERTGIEVFKYLCNVHSQYHKPDDDLTKLTKYSLCFICLTNLVTRIQRCYHAFCKSCTELLLNNQLSCPFGTVCEKGQLAELFVLSNKRKTVFSETLLLEVLNHSESKKQYTIVTILEQMSKAQLQVAKQEEKAVVGPWHKFLLCLFYKVAEMGEYGKTAASWLRSTLYRIDDFMFVYIPYPSEILLQHGCKLLKASHSIVYASATTLNKHKIQGTYIDYSNTVPSDILLQGPSVAEVKRTTTSWAIYMLELLKVDKMKPTASGIYFSVTLKIKSLLPVLCYFLIQQPAQIEQFLLKTAIAHILRVCFVQYYQSNNAQEIFDENANEDQSMIELRNTMLVDVAKILCEFYLLYQLNPPKASELKDDMSIINTEFRSFFTNWDKETIYANARSILAIPFIAHVTTLQWLAETGNIKVAEILHKLNTPDIHNQLRFCNICINVLYDLSTCETYHCNHTICNQCFNDIALFSTVTFKHLTRQISPICCPVCGAVTPIRVQRFILNEQNLDHILVAKINTMIVNGISEFTSINNNLNLTGDAKGSKVSICTKIGTAMAHVIAFPPVKVSSGAVHRWDNNASLDSWRLLVGILSILKHKNITTLIGATGPTSMQHQSITLSVVSEWHPQNLHNTILEWHSAIKVMKDIATGLNILHNLNWVLNEFDGSNIEIIEKKSKHSLRAILSDMSNAYPVSFERQSITRQVTAIPFIPPEYYNTGVYTTASDIYNFAQLFLEVCIKIFYKNDKQRWNEWYKGNGINQLPVHFPEQIKNLLNSCLAKHPQDRPSATTIKNQLKTEWANCNILKRFYHPLSGIKMWIAKQNWSIIYDRTKLQQLLYMETNNIFLGALRDFFEFLTATYNRTKTKSYAYAAAQDIRGFCTVISELIDSASNTFGNFASINAIETVLFHSNKQNRSHWLQEMYSAAYAEEDRKVYAVCHNTSAIAYIDQCSRNLNIDLEPAITILKDLENDLTVPTLLQQVERAISNIHDIAPSDKVEEALKYAIFCARLSHVYSKATLLCQYYNDAKYIESQLRQGIQDFQTAAEFITNLESNGAYKTWCASNNNVVM